MFGTPAPDRSADVSGMDASGEPDLLRSLEPHMRHLLQRFAVPRSLVGHAYEIGSVFQGHEHPIHLQHHSMQYGPSGSGPAGVASMDLAMQSSPDMGM